MLTLFVFYFFILGVIIGSFLNVVILRHNTGKTTGGRSACMVCKNQLTYKELVPLFSFLFQKGRCKHCKTKISWQYPLVELVTGVLFAANFYYLFQQTTSMLELLISVGFTSCIWALLMVIFVYDLKHKIIPDVFSLSAWGLSVVWIGIILFIHNTNALTDVANTGVYRAWIPAFAGMTNMGVLMTNTGVGMINTGSVLFWLNLFAGIIFYLFIYVLWKLSKGRLIGLGDAKLLLTIGTILGIVYGLSAIFISAWAGALYALYLLLTHRLSKGSKRITMKTEIPFGPFLIIGFLIVYFTHLDVTNISFILENFS